MPYLNVMGLSRPLPSLPSNPPLSRPASLPRALRVGGAGLLLSLLVGSVGGCAEECNGCTDINATPTPDPGAGQVKGFGEEHPHTWAMVRQLSQEVLVYASPPLITETRWYDQLSWSYFLVTWEDQGDGSVRQVEKMCSADLSEITVATTRGTQDQDILVPDALISHMPTQTWVGRFEEEGRPGDPTYSAQFQLSDFGTGPLYTVWGAELDDPVEDVCPMTTGDPEFDQDEDGFPGVTTTIIVEGKEFTDTYICQRLNFRQGPGQVDVQTTGTRIHGELLEVVNDQSQFGASNPLFPQEDPEVRWKEADSFYELVNLPDGSDCSAVDPALFSL